MGKDAVSVMVGTSSQVSKLENELEIAVNGVYTLADNTNNWIEAISNLETITQDYSEQGLEKHFIQTDSSIGLTDNDVIQAIKILNTNKD